MSDRLETSEVERMVTLAKENQNSDKQYVDSISKQVETMITSSNASEVERFRNKLKVGGTDVIVRPDNVVAEKYDVHGMYMSNYRCSVYQ